MTDHTDLTAFQRDTLESIARLDARDVQPYGLAIKRDLQALYDAEINHSRLYQNLDTLAELGLVARSPIDDRTNRYELTADGRALLERRAQTLADLLLGDATDPAAAQAGPATPPGGDRP